MQEEDEAILAVLLGCGLRWSEVVALTLGHIQQRDGRTQSARAGLRYSPCLGMQAGERPLVQRGAAEEGVGASQGGVLSFVTPSRSFAILALRNILRCPLRGRDRQ
jgi:integrase